MTVDRLVAGGCLVVAVVALATTALFDDPVEPTRDTLGPVDDPATTFEFLRYYERSLRGEWELEAHFERRGGEDIGLVSDWYEIQSGDGDQLRAAYGGLTGTFRGRVIECGQLADDESLCDAGPAPDPEVRSRRAIALAAEAVEPETGAYTLARAPDRTIAGQEAECFVLERRAGADSDLFGEEARYCYSDEAIPLLVVQRRGEVVDTRTATAVSTDVDESDFVELIESRTGASPNPDVRSPS